jgi:hypothetical protein
MYENDQSPAGRGSVRIAVAEAEGRPVNRTVLVAVVVFTMVLASAAVVLGNRFIVGGVETDGNEVPATPLGARSLTATTPAAAPAPPDPAAPPTTETGAERAVPGSTRLALLGPVPLVDTRDSGGLPAGSEVAMALPELPAGSTAVLLEVSLLDAAGPGAVTVISGAGTTTALRLPRAKAQTTATVVALIGADAELRARTEGGGRLLVNLVGAFEPVEASTAGRIVAVPATEVLRLVPATDGKDATIDLTTVPALSGAGTVSAALLQITADVGVNGGFVATGTAADARDQMMYWMPTSGDDRTRGGFQVVPVVDGTVHVHYEAGTQLTASLVGYVTDDTAPSRIAGLVVPVPPSAPAPTDIPAGGQADIEVIPAEGIEGVPADRVAATLLGITTTGEAAGGVGVHPPDAPAPATPTATASKGTARPALTLVETVDRTVRVTSGPAASVTLSPQAVVLGE